jgi:hypothetical protein
VRYYFNVVLGSRHIADPEGAEFSDLYAALVEAELAAREIAADELKNGGAVPADWHLEIADAGGRVHETVPFGTLFAANNGEKNTQASAIKERILAQHQRARTLFDETRSIAERVRQTFSEIRTHLHAFDRIADRSVESG